MTPSQISICHDSASNIIHDSLGYPKDCIKKVPKQVTYVHSEYVPESERDIMEWKHTFSTVLKTANHSLQQEKVHIFFG
jgi:hypothetical protein